MENIVKVEFIDMILKMETVMLAKKVHLTLIYVQQNTYKTL